MGVFIFFDSCDKHLIVLSRQLVKDPTNQRGGGCGGGSGRGGDCDRDQQHSNQSDLFAGSQSHLVFFLVLISIWLPVNVNLKSF
jgi:hypothetical protein